MREKPSWQAALGMYASQNERDLTDSHSLFSQCFLGLLDKSNPKTELLNFRHFSDNEIFSIC